jgi:prephenate dehydrogenase
MTGPRSELGAGDVAGALARLPDRIAFLGLGLIGGSIARGLRAAGSRARLVAWTPTLAGPEAALAAGAIDEVAIVPEVALAGAGLVILAGPPTAVLAAVVDPGAGWPALSPGAVVTDTASTKAAIVAAADAAGLPFVGGHPMAGRETAGFASSTADLFVDRPWVVTPGTAASPAAAELVDALALAVGARPVRLDPGEHDAAVATISHLPLLAAVALVEAAVSDPAGWTTSRALAATGWRDMTRLARGDVDMGAGIVATNRPAIAARLRAYRDAIDAWIAALEAAAPGDEVRARLAAARAVLDEASPS